MDNRSEVQKLEHTKQVEEWFGLRAQGWTLQQIADRDGCSIANVSQRLKRYRQSLPRESFNDYIALANARLEELRRALQDGIDAGNWKSIEVAIKLEDRIAKLHGLDRPVVSRVEVSNPTPDHVRDVISQLELEDTESVIIEGEAI